MEGTPFSMIRKLIFSFSLVAAFAVVEARAELLAHWKFEKDAPFEDAVSGLELSVESSDVSGKATFAVNAGKPAQLKESKTSLSARTPSGVDLRLRVNAPTRGGNPFRLSGNSWSLTGWFAHLGDKPGGFGHVIAGTHGYSSLEGRGFAGWCLRAIAEGEDKVKVAAVFSTGGEKPVAFNVASKGAVTTGEEAWHHFGLVWDHEAGAARLYVDGKLEAETKAPEGFDFATADRNAFRGIWIAGRPTADEGKGSDNWIGRIDDVKFFAATVNDEASMMAAFNPAKPEPKPKPKPEPTKVVAKPAPAKPKAPPPPPKPTEKILAVRTWTDLRQKTIEAAMVVPVAPVEGRVLLQTTDGIRLSLPLEKLSDADRSYAANPE